VLKYAWGDANVMMTPIIIQLDDDNCDGSIDARDIPEIVFTSFAGGSWQSNGTVVAISIVGGTVTTKWRRPGGANPMSLIAGGDIDGQPGNEVVVCTDDRHHVRAYRGDGTELWASPQLGNCFMPALADLDQDGQVEVITEEAILDGATGAIELVGPQGVVVSDVTGDGLLDLVGPTQVTSNTGTTLATATVTGDSVAVGDLDRDGVPEIAVIDSRRHQLGVWRFDPTQPGGARVIRSGVNINGTINPATACPGLTGGGGPPTIADMNGDGVPDVGVAGGVGLAVFDGRKLMDPSVADPLMWIRATNDCSSASTGSSVFDFEGDGRAELVYGDERTLRVYDGGSGASLFETCNTNGTLLEYPVIADVDNDGRADIVAVSNNYYSAAVCAGGATTRGVRIFGSATDSWVRTRPIWNQHTYHVTNVDDDGSIPRAELPNYRQPRLNNFRQNIQPFGEFLAPDLVVTVAVDCSSSYRLAARVYNLGEASAPAGVPVVFYVHEAATGGVRREGVTVATTRALLPAEFEDLVIDLPAALPDADEVHATVDEASSHAWHECRPDNNTSPPVSAACSGVD
jgi:hypothetical protein